MTRRALLAMLGAALVAVAGGGADAQGPPNLVVQVSTEPPGLDLTATPASATAGVVLYNIQECLLKVDRHGKLVPWLAERWHTADNRNYTFFLRRGVLASSNAELVTDAAELVRTLGRRVASIDEARQLLACPASVKAR